MLLSVFDTFILDQIGGSTGLGTRNTDGRRAPQLALGWEKGWFRVEDGFQLVSGWFIKYIGLG